MTADVATPSIESLSLMLWRERELLNELLYRLDVENLVLNSGHVHHLAPAASDVDRVLTALRETEALRILACTAVGEEYALGPDASLREIAAVAPAPWDGILLEHRDAFLAVSHQIMALAAQNRQSLELGQRAIRETLLGYGDTAGESANPYRAHDTNPVIVDRDI